MNSYGARQIVCLVTVSSVREEERLLAFGACVASIEFEMQVTRPTIHYRTTTLRQSTPTNIDMSPQHPVSSSSEKQKHSPAEDGRKGGGLGGPGPGDLEIGSPPPPAHRVHSQGMGFDAA